MDILTITTVLIIISAVFSYFNERFIKLPGTIGVVTISVVVSILILVAGKTDQGIAGTITRLAGNIDFSEVLLDIMLAFLLFASALHFDYEKLKAQRLPVFILSTLGVLISTAIFGTLLNVTTNLLHIELPMMYCFIFGALISPTDPIAVGSILKKSKIPPHLKTIISGESLFNDAVGLILFVSLVGITSEADKEFSIADTVKLFGQEVLGGIAIGLLVGYMGYRLMKSVKDFQTILLISVALVLGISVVAVRLHASVPLAAVTAGLIIGNNSRKRNDLTSQFLGRIWQLLDEVLNTILFVMIGLQLVVMPFLNNYWLMGLLSITFILIARLASVFLPAIFLLHRVNFANISILTWAGLRGGISIAMALSLPDSPYREVILASCYFIVIFSIIVQGLSLNKLAEKVVKTV